MTTVSILLPKLEKPLPRALQFYQESPVRPLNFDAPPGRTFSAVFASPRCPERLPVVAGAAPTWLPPPARNQFDRRPPRKRRGPGVRSRAIGIAAAGRGAACEPVPWRPGWRSGWPRTRWETVTARWQYPPWARGWRFRPRGSP